MKATTSTSIDLHFDIHDYKERLTPSKKGKFYCPVCNDPNFSIDKKGPGYACFKGGCNGKEIQEAIRPAAEVKQLLEADRERKRKTPIPYSLSTAHLKEMSLSGIPEDLARLNPRSVGCEHQIAEFLGWKGYRGAVGWLYTGVDPETGFDTGIGQFKPDEKFAFPDGSEAKYLSQKHAYDAACFRVPMWVWRKVSDRYSVPMPDGTAVINDSDEVTAAFWRWVLDNPQLPINPAEGGKKALLLLAKGRIGIPISGVEMATIGRGADLVPTLKKLAVKGRPVEPFYDADIIEKPDVENALMAFGAALTRAGCVITVPTWDLKLGKGVDDLAVNEGEAWESCLTVLSYKDWLKKLEQQRQESKKRSPVKKSKDTVDSLKRSFDKDSAESSSPAKSNNKRLLNLIGAQWGERLRLNEMTQQVEMDGSEINIDPIYFQMAEELDIDIPKQKASDLVVMLAKKNTYSPVRDYLNSLTDIAPINLECLALRYFGTDNPLHATLLKRTLIAAVARVFKPGCKVDTLCILQGDQGFLKSTFWQKLAGENWFTDNLNEGNEKDEKLKLRRYWLLEFSEFETAYKRKEVAQLKAFLSSSTDSLRVPYGKAIEDFARTSVFVGSTNGEEFLHDPTGERRYWVIPVTQRIPVKRLETERDAIWAAAVAAYKAGEQWWLTPEEDALLAQANQGWQSNDVWEADILDYLQHREVCTISELLTKAITVELQHQDKRGQMRVSVILRRNGWTKAPTQRRIDGKQQWYWERKVVTGGDGVVTEVVTPLNPLPVSIPEVVSPPVTTFLPNFPQNCNSANEPDEPDEPEKKKSFENRGGDTPAENLETPPGQGLEGVTTSPSPPQIIHNPIAPPEPETPSTAAPESIAPPEPDPELVNQGVAALRKAIAENDAVAVREAAKKSIKLDSTGRLKAAIKKLLSDEENEACRILANANRKQSQPEVEVETTAPIVLPDNSQQPETAEPATEPTEPEVTEDVE